MIRKLLLMSFAAPLMACALDEVDSSEHEAVATDDQSIIGGTVDWGDPSVVALFGDGRLLCTGTVIGPRTVLTAAHCLHPTVVGPIQAFDIRPGTTPTFPGIAVTGTARHAAFDPSNPSGGHDIGVVHTADPMPFPVVALAPVALSQPVRLVGYGNNTHNGTGAGTKREVTTNIIWSNNLLIQDGNSDQQICNGDSGGPAFQTINGRLVVVGVASFVYNQGSSRCVFGGFHSRVDTDLGYIIGNTF